ncbi:MAG: hypothetical protein IPL84_01170 [Chitinophagaceae bacterium]|nr:hypothetical protein [Chitinophagaceae bacterium]
MKYSFTLKDNNEKSFRQLNWFLFFLHIVAAGIFALNTTENLVRVGLFILLGFYAVIYTVYTFFRYQRKAFETFNLIMAFLYVSFWFKYVNVTAGIIFLVVYIFIALVQAKKTAVHFSAEGIHLTRVFKTVVFPWTEMANVVLKDDLLTIDFKSNKIIQVEISEQGVVVDEGSFNLFCVDQMNRQA